MVNVMVTEHKSGSGIDVSEEVCHSGAKPAEGDVAEPGAYY